MNYNIMLIGFMGTGKTTISKKLSSKLNIDEIDMDKYIVKYEGKSINDIFKDEGEEYFRKAETVCLERIQRETGYVVSCGGGAVLRDENVKLMKRNGIIVLLTATPRTVYDRVKNNRDRPVLNGHMNVGYISDLMSKRADRYNEVADITVSTDNRTPDEICREIIVKLEKFKVKNS